MEGTKTLYKLLGSVREHLNTPEGMDAYFQVMKALDQERCKAFVPYVIQELESQLHSQIETLGTCNTKQEVEQSIQIIERVCTDLDREVRSFSELIKSRYCKEE